MGFVRRKHQFWAFQEFATSGRLLEQFRQQPQQESGVELGAFISLSAASMLMTPRPRLSVCIRSAMLSGRLPRTRPRPDARVPAAALDGADRGRRNIAVLRGETFGVFTDMGKSIARRSFKSSRQQAVVVGNLECQREHALLSCVQVEHARAAATAPFRKSWRAPGVPVPRRRPRNTTGRLPLRVPPAELLDAFLDPAFEFAGLGEAGQIALTSAMNTGRRCG